MATALKRQKAHAVLQNSKKDRSPKWDGAETWSGEQFHKHFRDSMDWYRLEKSAKELKPQVINWMGRNSFDKDLIDAFKKTKDSRSHFTMGAIAANLNNGMPSVHPAFNKGRNSAEWLKKEILTIINEGQEDPEGGGDRCARVPVWRRHGGPVGRGVGADP